jgi:predicted O-methyltransferase YrrM
MRLPWRVPNYGPLIETSLTEREAAEIHRLAAGRRVLEIGAAYGYSTVLMAQVALEVVSVDPHEVHHSFDRIKANLRGQGVSGRVVIRRGTSAEILPQYSPEAFDLVFVDGDHTAAGVGYDLAEAQRLVTDDGVLAFHDWNEETCPDVRPTLEAWRHPSYIVDTLAIYCLG